MLPAILGGAQALLGAGQAIFGGIKAKKAQRKMEGMIDSYKPNESIMDYYNKALQRYNSNPYQSTTYQNQMQNANRTTAAGIGALNDRRSAVGGVSRLAALQNQSSLDAGQAAEAEQGQRLNQLAAATAMKVPEDKYKFEAKFNLLGQKAGAANQGVNAGISNMFGGFGSIADYAMINKMYGGNGSGGGNANNETILGDGGAGASWQTKAAKRFGRI